MKIIRNEKSITIYPEIDEKHRLFAFQKALVITPDGKYTHMLHRTYKDNSWRMIQFKMNKGDLQQYINELQVICSNMEG